LLFRLNFLNNGFLLGFSQYPLFLSFSLRHIILLLIFGVTRVVALDDLGQHQVQREEGAKNDQEDEKHGADERLVRVRVVVQHEDPAFERDGHKNAAHGRREVVEIDDVEHDELFRFGQVLGLAEADVRWGATDEHLL